MEEEGRRAQLLGSEELDAGDAARRIQQAWQRAKGRKGGLRPFTAISVKVDPELAKLRGLTPGADGAFWELERDGAGVLRHMHAYGKNQNRASCWCPVAWRALLEYTPAWPRLRAAGGGGSPP